MKTTLTFSILAMAIVFTACKETESKAHSKIKTASWLIGNWENKTKQGDFSENWVEVNDSIYRGESYFIKGKDTLFAESVELGQKGTDLFYTVTTKGQNEELPVAFKLTRATATEMVFENPKHDFPNKITYKLVTKDSLVAAIYGMEQGKPASETYPMGRKRD